MTTISNKDTLPRPLAESSQFELNTSFWPLYLVTEEKKSRKHTTREEREGVEETEHNESLSNDNNPGYK